jgi:hypothetical protein
MSHSSRSILVIMITLATVFAATPRIAHADVSSPRSTLTVGDWWKYDFQTVVEGLDLKALLTETLVSQQSISVIGTNYDTFRITIAGSGPVAGTILGYAVTGSWTLSGDDYVRTSDLGDIKSHASIQISAQVGPMTNSYTVTQITDTVNNPPVQTLQFPLTTGNHWSVTVASTTTTTTYSSSNPSPVTNTTTTTTAENSDVISYAVTMVPAGSFDTYLIRTSRTAGYTESSYSPQVENMIKIQDYNSTGLVVDSFTLRDYSAWPFKSTIGLYANGIAYNAAIETDDSNFNVHQDAQSIIFQVTGTDGVTGKASIWIPRGVNNTDLQVFIDEKPTSSTINQNQTQYQLLFNYPLSTHTVMITYASVKQQSPFLQRYFLPIILGAVGVAAAIIAIVTLLVVRRRSTSKQPPLPFWQPSGTPGPGTSPPPTSILPNIALAGVVIAKEVLVLTAPISLALSVWMGWIAAWSCQSTICSAQTAWAFAVFPYFLVYGVGAIVSAALIERRMLKK